MNKVRDQRLSDTNIGRQWLENFEDRDRAAATVLLDSLRTYSEAEFQFSLVALLRKVIHESIGPIVLYPVRPPRDPELHKDFPAIRVAKGWADSDGVPVIVPEPDVDRPLVGDEGSELLVARILRDVSSEMRKSGHKVTNYEGIEELRSRKVRTIVLVDDYSGSGDSAERCICAWMANPSIRSWRSFGWVKLTYVSHLVSSSGLTRIRSLQASMGGSVEYAETALDFANADWSDLQREEITALCKRYARRAGRALGWRNSAGLVILPHTTPNNLPLVFTQETGRGGRSWRPLLRRSNVTSRDRDLLENSFQSSFDLSHAALRAGQKKLAKELGDLDNRLYAQLMVVLGVASRRRVEVRTLEKILRISERDARELMALCIRLRMLIPGTLRISDSGQDELTRARSGRRRAGGMRARLHDNDAPYYPSALRRDR